MRILVISDTHRKIGNVIEILEKDTKFDHICHLGDHASDAKEIELLYNIPVTCVTGNCDYYEPGVSDEALVNLQGVRMFLTHGHMYRVKSSPILLKKIFEERKVDIVLFGHTHKAYIEYCDNRVIVNPGSISFPRDGKPSYAVIEIKKTDEHIGKLQSVHKRIKVKVKRM